MQLYDCIVPYVNSILHRGRFWAISTPSGSLRWWCLRSCWTVLSNVMQALPGCLLQSPRGEANRILLAPALSSMHAMCRTFFPDNANSLNFPRVFCVCLHIHWHSPDHYWTLWTFHKYSLSVCIFPDIRLTIIEFPEFSTSIAYLFAYSLTLAWSLLNSLNFSEVFPICLHIRWYSPDHF